MALPSSTLDRWRFALKPASWPKLLVPTLLGHGLGVDATGSLSVSALALGLLLTALFVVYVVCLNDFGDWHVDALKRRMFPETSPKTIPDGVLHPRPLLIAGMLAGVGAVVLAVLAGLLMARPLLAPLMLASLATFAAYSLPPIRLNYRGGGELLETFGVGLLLPALSSYLQSGQLLPPSAPLLIGWTVLALASAIASGLSDEESDRAGGKRTVVTLLGNGQARRIVNGAALLGPLMWLGAAWLIDSGPPRMIGIFAAAVALDEWWTLRKRSQGAITNAFTAQTQYKAALHALIWRSGMAWAVGLSVAPLLGF
jgi:1,4-dihydroxy-2-naphthoate octaprenyltransferase/chlorophyll synthase